MNLFSQIYENPSPELLMLSSFFFCFLSPQQPNIKQKFVALLKRFKVTDEVGASAFALTHPLHVCISSRGVAAEVDVYFSFGFEDTERCVGEMWQNN